MSNKQPTSADYEEMPRLTDHRWQYSPENYPSEVNLDTIVPSLTEEERLAIRLSPRHKAEDYQLQRLRHTHLFPKVVYDADRRNCSVEGGFGLANNRSAFTNRYRIEDDGRLYHITLLNDIPVRIDCKSLEESVDKLLLTYWQQELITKIFYYDPEGIWSGGDEQKPYEAPKRRALTEEEHRVRALWERGEIYDVDPNCPPEVRQLIDMELTKPEVQQGYHLLRQVGLFVGPVAFKSGRWNHEGGFDLSIKYHRDNPQYDRLVYYEMFMIKAVDSKYEIRELARQPAAKVLAEIAPDHVTDTMFDTFTQASEAVIRYYRLMGLIKTSEGATVAGHAK